MEPTQEPVASCPIKKPKTRYVTHTKVTEIVDDSYGRLILLESPICVALEINKDELDIQPGDRIKVTFEKVET